MTPDLAAEVMDLEAVARIEEDWRGLAGRCLEPNAFNEPDFLLAAARHLAGRGRPHFIVVRQRGHPGRLVGLCPIAVSRWPGMPAMVWTHAQATAAYPLLDRDVAEPALATMLGHIGRFRRRPAALLVSGVASDGPTAALQGRDRAVHCAETRSRAVLRHAGSGVGLSSKSRKELRRQWNRLAERGPLVFASATGPDDVAVALDRFFALEARGWKGRRGTALGSTAETRRFAQAAVMGLARRSQCRIDILELGGEPIAMGIVLTSGDRAFFWKTAYDESLAHYSPGLQATLHLTEVQRRDASIAMTDSCAVPGHSMIDRVWAERIAVGDYLVGTDADRPAAFAWACALEARRRQLRSVAKALIARVGRRGRPSGAPEARV